MIDTDLYPTWDKALLLDSVGITKPRDFPVEDFVRRHQKELDELHSRAIASGYRSVQSYVLEMRPRYIRRPDGTWVALSDREERSAGSLQESAPGPA